MLAEVRGLVALQDLELFDRLVVHQDREAHQAWHAGLAAVSPQCPCSLAAPQVHDLGHGTRALVSLRKCAPLWDMFSYSGQSGPTGRLLPSWSGWSACLLVQGQETGSKPV